MRRKKAFDLTPLGEDGASDTLTCGIQQLDALEKLLEHKTDVMLVAKTSFGKSLIFQLAPLLMPDPGEPGIAFDFNAAPVSRLRSLQLTVLATNLRCQEHDWSQKRIEDAQPFVP